MSIERGRPWWAEMDDTQRPIVRGGNEKTMRLKEEGEAISSGQSVDARYVYPDEQPITEADAAPQVLGELAAEIANDDAPDYTSIAPAEPATHVHTYEVSINNTHTALMWCTACGPKESYTGLMAGHAEAIVWHKIGIGESNA